MAGRVSYDQLLFADQQPVAVGDQPGRLRRPNVQPQHRGQTIIRVCQHPGIEPMDTELGPSGVNNRLISGNVVYVAVRIDDQLHRATQTPGKRDNLIGIASRVNND